MKEANKDNKLLKICRKMFQGFLTFVIFVMAILLLLVIYNFWQIKMLHKDYANYFGYTYMNVISGSMEPSIKVDDFVFIKLGNKDLKKGDVITFKVDDSIITHRITSIVGKQITTKGDANNDSDNLITFDDVIGKVVFVGHEYNVYIKVLSTPLVFITGFISLILFDVALTIDDKKGSENSEKKK